MLFRRKIEIWCFELKSKRSTRTNKQRKKIRKINKKEMETTTQTENELQLFETTTCECKRQWNTKELSAHCQTLYKSCRHWRIRRTPYWCYVSLFQLNSVNVKTADVSECVKICEEHKKLKVKCTLIGQTKARWKREKVFALFSFNVITWMRYKIKSQKKCR